MPDMPKRPIQHETGDAAVRAVQFQMPARWISNDIKSDYGTDLIITIVGTLDRDVRDEFYIQSKGGTALSYIEGGRTISQALETSTINWLQAKSQPVMVTVCDTVAPGKPVYYVWLAEALKELESRVPNWQEQASATLHVPVDNVLSSTHDAIETYVREHYLTLRVNNAIASAAYPYEKRAPHSRDVDLDIPTYVKTNVLPFLNLSASSSSPSTDGPLGETLSKISVLIESFNDRDAHRLLDEIETEVQRAAPALIARFLNARGVLLLRTSHFSDALQMFTLAAERDGAVAKYEINKLTTEYLIAEQRLDKVPADWRDRLEQIVAREPTSEPSIALRARVMAQEGDLSGADTFVRAAKLSPPDSIKALGTLADIHKDAEDYVGAISILDELRDEEHSTSAFSLSLRAFCLFRLSLLGQSLQFDGLGPSRLDVAQLHRAADAYRDACRAFAALGYPELAEDTFHNAATVLVVEGYTSEAASLARQFLQHHPDSRSASAALAMALAHGDEPDAALPYARIAAEDDTPLSFKNLLLTLLRSEQFDELVELVEKRRTLSFRTPEEQTLSLELAAISLNRLGDYGAADSLVTELVSAPHSRPSGLAARAVLARMRGSSSADVATTVRAALAEHPQDRDLLSALFGQLVPPTIETASELVDVVRNLASLRQLNADEAFAIAQSYVLLKDFENALSICNAAISRFPSEPGFLFLRAHALHELGRPTEAFDALKKYLEQGKRSYAAYRNLGQLARAIMQLDDAIRLFQLALPKTADPEDISEIHGQLYELKRSQGISGKELLRHAIGYGGATASDVEREARFLTMCMVCRLDQSQVDQDEELRSWIAQIEARRRAFSEAYPRHKNLISIKTPEDWSNFEQVNDFLAEIAALTLPGQIQKGRLDMLIRGGPWPLAARRRFFGFLTLPSYWRYCTNSDSYAHSIHISVGARNDPNEQAYVTLDQPVCVDLIALLTLRSLGILDAVTSLFKHLFLAESTLRAIEAEEPFDVPDEFATELRAWWASHRHNVNVRRARRHKAGTQNGLLVLPNSDVDRQLLGDGTGETLRLAGELGGTLYSDDSYVRHLATSEGIRQFSTVPLLRFLSGRGNIKPDDTVKLLSQLLNANYNHISLLPVDFQLALRLRSRDKNDAPLTRDELSDGVIGVFLKSFGDPRVSGASLVGVARAWFVYLVRDDTVDSSTKSNIVSTLAFRLAHRTNEGIIAGIRQFGFKGRLILFCVQLLLTAHLNQLTAEAWSILDSALQLLCDSEDEYRDAVTRHMPEIMFAYLKHTGLGDDELNILVMLPSYLPDSIRIKWTDVLFSKLRSAGFS